MPDILVVDDMPMHLDYLKEELEARGHQVRTADNGTDALKLIAAARPDVLLLDMSMPVMDGLEVLHVLRAEPDLENLPVILCTARKEVEDRVEGLDAGADDYITKPFHIGEVLARIKALLRIQELQHRVVARERELARIEGVTQTMVTLAHHINNATQSIAGIAQLCADTPDRQDLKDRLVEITDRQCAKITAVLKSLQEAVEHASIDPAAYAGQSNRMLDIEERLQKRLEDLGIE